MGKVLKLVNNHGVPFNVRLVEKGEKYGLDWCLTHDKDDPLVEFYDASQDKDKFTEYGQFVTRYYLKTILDRDPQSNAGLMLDGGSPAWVMSGENMREIYEFFG